ncbi:MAG TPA: hypothetical protein VKQ30_25775 [Ktedonobacterales bacterium]|nr:hypothetical protein [Ktedonobacterales bacterium]
MRAIRMKVIVSLTRGRLGVLATFAILCALVTVPIASVLANELDTTAAAGQPGQVFYTTSDAGNGAEIFAINVQGGTVTVRDVGPTNGGDCVSLALSASGKLYSMCGPLFGTQQLATIDTRTGQADLFGAPVSGLAVMALSFGRNGNLYAVGDCNPDNNFECTRGSDPNYNSLYRVDMHSGAFARVGSTGAPQFFMDLALGPNGQMFGVTSTDNPSTVPASLYRINVQSGEAQQHRVLFGSNSIMGLAFGQDDKLYATDFTQNSRLYAIDLKTGFETTIAALPFGFSSGLELLNSEDERQP